ncbi:MAG: DNA translocase FtsK [Candidatus Omnitrophota bacterium]
MDETRKNEIKAVILFAASLFLFLSIFTFTDQDLSFYTSDPNVATQNVTGIVGSYIGGFLLFLVGKASYVIPLLILIWGISRLLQLEPRKTVFKVFGTIFLVTAVSASLSMLVDFGRTTSFSQGGLIGTLVSDFLLKYLGKAGATVFIIAMIALSMLVATEFLILPVAIAIYKFIANMLNGIRNKLAARAETFASKREARENRVKAAKREMARKLDTMKRQVEEVKKTSLARKPAGEVKSKPRPAEPKIVASKEPVKADAKPARVAAVSDTSTGQKLEYKLPNLDLLKKSSKTGEKERTEDLKAKAALLESTLAEFGVEAKVVKINRGPVITMFELEPAIGTKVTRITSLGDNLSLAMKSANIRIVAPLPGKGTIGIEVPNDKSELVLLRDILETEEYNEEDSTLKLALGKDLEGTPIVTDLSKMPHLLIAGATGSGKTVCLNGIISSLLFNATPDELKFLMVDPKRVELMMFESIPHLLSPIVTNPKKVAAALGWVVKEMERRYEIFAEKGVRNILRYKEVADEDWENLPFIIVIVDELADLMVIAQQEVEGAIMRIAQLSRAAGIHMILATQRPSVNVVTGVIKANFPARISFKVASKVDSRTVLDANGAEKLLGRGDMLFLEPGQTDLIRGQCSLVEDGEIKNVVKVIKQQARPQYIKEVAETQERKKAGVEQEKDELYREAVQMVIQTKQASVSMIQRRLRVGYTRAARMIDIMEEEGIVGPYNGAKPREILVDSAEELEPEELESREE